MKYIVVIGDGMADYPLKELGGKTPLQGANTPNMDKIALNGVSGLLKTVPDNMTPGSDVANLSIFGYNPEKYYTGRGPIEAASIGAKMDEQDVAFRCNLITEKSGLLSDFNADHISTVEASEIIETLNTKFHDVGKFYLGTSYRHLFVTKKPNSANLISTPPHDVVNEPINNNLLKPSTDASAIELNNVMEESKKILENHPVNQKRMEEGKNPANMIWLWGQGVKPALPNFKDKYGVKAATITGVDLIKGLGVYMGLTNIEVPGATGYFDTDYCAKAKNTVDALEDHDMVFVHVEAPDEAGHAGDLEEKIKAIERIDDRIIGKLLDELPSFKEYSIAVLPDHPTPISIRTHTRDPVPFSMFSSNGESDTVNQYDEESVKNGVMGISWGYEFIEKFLNGSKPD
ncbi:proposed homoserine kinase [Methanobacterium lacus]|uniref:2,3-bisphosphoglycerate-independent phosphoglycerate mutase n=1 Tax=Methanobacterium lacus (strain AL-21) TaxID=877455 RepID=F0T6A1_METLA|nr:cofactor-independent phosphoglycerate mutase [Methanobacterium lacus]ADZ09416.1 proposed homoserine kinase [Methanobacterium lacus]